MRLVDAARRYTACRVSPSATIISPAAKQTASIPVTACLSSRFTVGVAALPTGAAVTGGTGTFAPGRAVQQGAS